MTTYEYILKKRQSAASKAELKSDLKIKEEKDENNQEVGNIDEK
jgi:hypothetical protein